MFGMRWHSRSRHSIIFDIIDGHRNDLLHLHFYSIAREVIALNYLP